MIINERGRQTQSEGRTAIKRFLFKPAYSSLALRGSTVLLRTIPSGVVPPVLVISLLMHVCTLSIAQKTTDTFSRSYYYIVDSVVNKSPAEALRLSDSLLQEADNPQDEIRVYMLKGVISTQMGNQVDALDFGLRAEKLALRSGNLEWQVRSSGFLSAIYRDINLPAQALPHIEIAEKANQRLKGELNYPYIQLSIHAERANYYYQEQNYEKVIQEYKMSLPLIDDLLAENRAYYQVEHYVGIGGGYLALEQYEQAEQAFRAAEGLFEGSGSLLGTALYSGLGKVALQKGQLDSARKLFHQAEGMVALNQHFSNIEGLYKNFAQYYRAAGQLDSALHYEGLYLKQVQTQASFTADISNQLIARSLLEKKRMKSSGVLLLAAVAVLLTLLLLLIFYMRKIRKRNRRKFESLMQQLSENAPLSQLGADRDAESGADFSETLMPQETEDRLLDRLHLLELQGFYLEAGVSLASVASRLESNTRYVSYIIKKHKGSDFNNYVNRLRIVHVLSQFEENPLYRNYKLSYIAAQSGFSSHSRFAAVFKKVTGVTPSSYIASIKKGPVPARKPRTK